VATLFPTLSRMRDHPTGIWVFAGLSLFALSFLAWLFPLFETVIFIVLTLALFFITMYSLEWGISLFFFEIILGSFGRWIVVSLGGTLLSIRIGLFLAVMMGWICYCTTNHLSARRVIRHCRTCIKQNPWIGIGIIMASYGLVRAYFLGNHFSDVWDDSNQWLTLAIAVPIACAHRIRLKTLLARAWMNGSVALGIFALCILYFFTHDATFNIGLAIYRWSRVTHIGELTILSSLFLRIFLQSQILLLPVWLSCIGVQTSSYQSQALSILIASSLILSFSRSFAVALVLIIGISFFFLLPSSPLERLKRILISFFFGAMLVFIVSQFPLPKAQGGSLTASFIARATLNDAATATRWSLLPALWHGVVAHPLLGSGFGATITYTSSDPRVLQMHPTGEYSTHAFEWGILDLWFKFGLLGLVWYASILLFAWRLIKKRQWTSGLSIGVLAVVHIFTPYLNHPIGFAALLLITLLSTQDDLPTELFDAWLTPPLGSILNRSRT